MNEFAQWLKQHREAWWFALLLFLLCIGFLVLEWFNHRSSMADFRVYYDAANAMRSGNQVYGVAFGVGSGFYKYSPFAGCLFIPIAMLPYSVASVIYYLLVSGAVVYASLRFVHMFSDNSSGGRLLAVLFFVSLFMADHIERELHLGNVNLFLLLGSLLMYSKVEKQPVVAGSVFALMLLFKPHFALLIPYLVWKKQWKLLAVAVLAVALGLILPALFFGWEGNTLLHTKWYAAIRDHNMALDESPNTVYGLLHSVTGGAFTGTVLIGMCLLLVAFLFLLFIRRNDRTIQQGSVCWIEFFILIAMIPNLVHTDTEHFMWSWPLVAFCVTACITKPTANRWIYVVVLLLAFIPYGINSPDLVGRQLEQLFDEGGLLGLANVIIIIVSVCLFLNQPQVAVKA
ncbi:MAG: glycosyltransferase family 87 protein [Flavobacteriales bacterium]